MSMKYPNLTAALPHLSAGCKLEFDHLLAAALDGDNLRLAFASIGFIQTAKVAEVGSKDKKPPTAKAGHKKKKVLNASEMTELRLNLLLSKIGTKTEQERAVSDAIHKLGIASNKHANHAIAAQLVQTKGKKRALFLQQIAEAGLGVAFPDLLKAYKAVGDTVTAEKLRKEISRT